MFRPILLCGLLLAAGMASAQTPDDLPDEDDWILENGYTTDLLFLHGLVNYSYDPAWQFDWERRRFADNALRLNTGSVASDELLTDIDLNLNEALNDDWRVFAQFTRDGFRRRQARDELLLIGLERRVFESSALYFGVNPEYGKEFIDLEGGYGWYSDDRSRYFRIGVRVEDFQYAEKNQLGGTQEGDPVKLTWATRFALGERLYLYSEGVMGSGFERSFPDADESPDLARHNQNDNQAEVRLTHLAEDGTLWSFNVEYFDFEELKEFRQPGFDYDYESRQLNAGVEHVRYFGDRHRLRLVAQFVDWEASSVGFREHDYSRQDVVGGVFYEYLWTNSGLTFAYAAGSPDFSYVSPEPEESYTGGSYTDKLIINWRYDFSKNATIRFGLSHEVSESGFGGGAVQYQMFF